MGPTAPSQRPYRAGSTGSHPNTEVKQRRVGLVLGWETAWELPMSLAYTSFCPSLRRNCIFVDFLKFFFSTAHSPGRTGYVASSSARLVRLTHMRVVTSGRRGIILDHFGSIVREKQATDTVRRPRGVRHAGMTGLSKFHGTSAVLYAAVHFGSFLLTAALEVAGRSLGTRLTRAVRCGDPFHRLGRLSDTPSGDSQFWIISVRRSVRNGPETPLDPVGTCGTLGRSFPGT